MKTAIQFFIEPVFRKKKDHSSHLSVPSTCTVASCSKYFASVIYFIAM
jgi:hypothetical protein